jgi:hypothetical protein
MREEGRDGRTRGSAMAIALAGGVAWAAIPGDGGVIQGCYDGGGEG